MTGREFFAVVRDADELTWVGIQKGGPEEEDCVVIQSSLLQDARRAIPVSEIKRCPEQVLSCLMGRRMFRIMTHLTRIVGYYSRVQNWNKSKLAELKDRQKGRYCVSELERSREVVRELEKVA